MSGKLVNPKTRLNTHTPLHPTHTTCADEQDVIGAVHRLHSVHEQLTELVINTNSDQEGSLSQWQHIFLKQVYSVMLFIVVELPPPSEDCQLIEFIIT